MPGIAGGTTPDPGNINNTPAFMAVRAGGSGVFTAAVAAIAYVAIQSGGWGMAAPSSAPAYVSVKAVSMETARYVDTALALTQVRAGGTDSGIVSSGSMYGSAPANVGIQAGGTGTQRNTEAASAFVGVQAGGLDAYAPPSTDVFNVRRSAAYASVFAQAAESAVVQATVSAAYLAVQSVSNDHLTVSESRPALVAGQAGGQSWRTFNDASASAFVALKASGADSLRTSEHTPAYAAVQAITSAAFNASAQNPAYVAIQAGGSTSVQYNSVLSAYAAVRAISKDAQILAVSNSAYVAVSGGGLAKMQANERLPALVAVQANGVSQLIYVVTGGAFVAVQAG